MHFCAFWCTSCGTPWPLHDLYWFLSPFKCPFNPEKHMISHSGLIWNTFALSWYGDHFGPFWSILVHFCAFWCNSCVTPWPLHDLHWLFSPFKCPFNPEKDIISHSGQIRNTFALSWYSDHFGPFWSIFVHLIGDPSTHLHRIFRILSKICNLCIKSFWTPPILPS